MINSFKIIDDDAVYAHYRRAILRQHRHRRQTNRMWLMLMIAAMMFAIVIDADVDLVLNDLEAVSVSALLPYSLDRATIWNTFPRTLTAFFMLQMKKIKSIENELVVISNGT